jgi:hypothetical protein
MQVHAENPCDNPAMPETVWNFHYLVGAIGYSREVDRLLRGSSDEFQVIESEFADSDRRVNKVLVVVER